MTTRKQLAAFPEVATIRKGAPKTQNQPGADLKDRFRVVFAPGADSIAARFKEIYKTDQPTRIRAMVPFPSVWKAWECYNEAYNAGRLIARADDDHFLVYRDPQTGEYKVREGDPNSPHMPYAPGMKITYQRGDKVIELPIRSTGRLRLWLPDLFKMVYFTLKTTSFYDCQHISANLAAVQGIADAINGGNAAGIPLWIYRVEREITWNKPGGSATRIKKWLVAIEVDEEFVRSAYQRMSQFALTGQQPIGLLQPVNIEGYEDPTQPDEDEDEVPGDWSTTPEPAMPDPAPSPASPTAPLPPASSPKPASAADLPAGLKMALDTAKTVKSRTTNELYVTLPTPALSGRLTQKLRIRPADRDEMTAMEIDAIQTILYYRNHPQEQ